MTLNEIRKHLNTTRLNGIYFREDMWSPQVLAYLSKQGKVFLMYRVIPGRNIVAKYSIDMQNMLNTKDNLEIWEGSV